MLETLDYTIRIGSTPTFLYFNLYIYMVSYLINLLVNLMLFTEIVVVLHFYVICSLIIKFMHAWIVKVFEMFF